MRPSQGKKKNDKDRRVAPIFVPRQHAEASQDGARSSSQSSRAETDPLEDSARPASKTDISSLMVRIGDVQAFLASEIDRGTRAVQAEIASLGSRTAALESRTENLVSQHNTTVNYIATLETRIDTLETAAEDISNRSRRNNLSIRGLPESVAAAELENTLVGVFKRMVPSLPTERLHLDRAHRVFRSPTARSNQPRDVVVRLHYFQSKEAIQRAGREMAVEYEGSTLQLFQDIAPATLAKRRAWRPFTEILRQHDIKYAWGYPFKIMLTHEGRHHSLSKMAEASALFMDWGFPEPEAPAS
uniref:Uncharacterized protein n=1 Tax=Leptobrachium leishanense TaxID=445787 RepID=A0A8C5PPN5_9ANUR